MVTLLKRCHIVGHPYNFIQFHLLIYVAIVFQTKLINNSKVSKKRILINSTFNYIHLIVTFNKSIYIFKLKSTLLAKIQAKTKLIGAHHFLSIP